MAHDSLPPRAGAGSRELVPFSTAAGYRLAGGEPDIRGWDLVGSSGARLGTVEDLLIDPAVDEVRAVVIAAGAAHGTERRHAVLPLERVRIDAARRSVASDETAESIAALPAYGPAGRRGTGASASPGATAEREAHPGVTVERAADGEEVIRVPIVEEQLVVERRPVVKEVVLIRKRAVQDARVVEADLRKERLEVERREAEGRR